MCQTVSNILIGGASHVGKTTFCRSLAQALAWEVFSTDTFARHPGRPWPHVRPHVADFYAHLSDESIFTFLLHHHENMWPGIEHFLQGRLNAGSACLLEGSALRPEYMAGLSSATHAVLCLVASSAFLQERIHTNSRYALLTAEKRSLVDTFLERTVRDNEAVIAAAKSGGIECVDVSDQRAVLKARTKLIDLVTTTPFAG